MIRGIFLLLMVPMYFGCAGKVNYMPPGGIPFSSNTAVVQKSKSDLWKQIVPMLGKQFFVINNLDKESGIINVSYSGNPESYVDCGILDSFVQNARGERHYNFPAAKAHQVYEVMDMDSGGHLFY